jgi:seryl-tRNA synthetase
MHDIKAIRTDPKSFIEALSRRGEDSAGLALLLVGLDGKRREAILAAEQLLARRNAISKEVKVAMDSNQPERAEALRAEVTGIKSQMQKLEAEAKAADEELKKTLEQIPNLPLDEVPEGIDEHGNVVRHHFGAMRNYAFVPKRHEDLGGALGFMDFKTAAKLSGARFVVLKKGLARLDRAIGQFMLDLHTNEHGYTEINPPLMVRDEVMFGTGQLPKFSNDQYRVETEEDQRRHAYINFEQDRKAVLDYAEENGIQAARDAEFQVLGFGYRPTPERRWLIPTAEVSLTNLVRESILDEKELPLRFTALTPCFRAEAGAAGRDTRGMIRQHQFTKVELVSITTPENSKDELERMLSSAEEVLRRLDLHYRVMTLCAGDMGFSAQKTYDIEVWMPGQGEGGAYREISSCSVCGDFQARRMDARYRDSSNKPRFVHTLNGSGTAVGRALIAVMETYQQEDGSIAVPDVLQPYMGGAKVVERDK